jgi:hypothetical protein
MLVFFLPCRAVAANYTARKAGANTAWLPDGRSEVAAGADRSALAAFAGKPAACAYGPNEK